MDSKDLRDASMFSDGTQPEEAAQNIDRSRLFEIPPDNYKDLKSELEPRAVSVERIPATVAPATQEFVTQSKQHFALTQKDIPAMDTAERIGKNFKNKAFDLANKVRERNVLLREQADSFDGKLSPENQELLQDYDNVINEMSKEDPATGLMEKYTVDVGAAAVDVGRSYTENTGLIAGVTSVGTALGAVGGFLGTFGNPAGAIVGAKMGTASGLAAAAAIVPFVDAYQEQRGSVYGDLGKATNDKGEPLNLSHGRKLVVSQAVAVVSGAAAAYAGKLLANNNPFLRKFVDPKSAAKYVLSSPKLMAALDIAGGIFNNAKGEMVEEGVQQIAETVATEFGKIDESEGSFENALSNIFSAETLKNVGYSMAVGAGAGGSFSAATNTPMYGKVKKEYEKIQRVSLEKKEVLQTQNMLLEMNAALHGTDIQKLAPEEARKFKQSMLEKVGFEDGAWFTVEDLRKFADEPEKGKKVRSIIDMNPELVKLAQDTNSSIQMSKADVLDIMTEFPEFSDYMRNTPDGQNPLDIRNEAKNFSANLEKADSRRIELMKTLGIVEDTDGIAARMSLDEDLKESPYFADENDYLEQSMLTPREGILTEKESQEFGTDILESRLATVRTIKADNDRLFNSIENKVVKETGDLNQLTIQENGQQVTLDFDQLDKDADIVDSFKNKRKDGLNANHAFNGSGKGIPSYAIDPIFLPNDTREGIVADPMLTERKVFVVGGLHPDEAAALLGVESGDKLIKILANTPDKKTIAQRKKQRKIELKRQVQQGFKEDKQKALDDSFSKRTTLHLREMEFMLKKSWPTVKRGIIKIAGKLPTIESLNLKAKSVIKGMKIRELNPNQFKQGEARSQKAAMKQFVNTEFEQAFASKEKAAFNSELMKESLKAKDKINSYQKFWKKAADKTAQQELKDAGYLDVMNEFMSLYKLDGNVKNEAEQIGFKKWVKKQNSLGYKVPEIPARLNNTQISYKDLTVEEYQKITEMGQFILDKAKYKNKILAIKAAKGEFQTQETIAARIAELASEHPDFDTTRAKREEKTTKDGDYLTNVQNGVKTLMSAVNTTKNIALQMDNDIAGGFFYRTLVEPMVTAQTAKRAENLEMVKYTKDVIKEFYGSQKEYDAMVNERVEIPEFKNIDTLNNGSLRKIDLFRMMAFIGDPDGRANMENFKDSQGVGLSFETLMAVLDREVTEKEAGFVQNFFVNPYKKFTERSAALHKATTGIDAEMIEGVPFTHKGKVYEGGYQPLGYQRLTDDVRAGKELESMQEEGLLTEDGFFARLRATENTKQDRLKQRTGSQRPMQLDFEDHFNALEDIMHDLHFREVGIDLMKVLKQPENVKNVKSVIGAKKFVLMLDSIKDVVSKTSDKDSPLYRDQNSAFNKLLATGKSLHAIKTIGLNFASAAIQWDSLLYLPLRSGPKTFMYMSKTIAKMVANPMLYNDMIETAKQILPDIQFEQDAIDDTLVKTHEEFIPSSNVFFKKYKKAGTVATRLLQMRRKSINMSFGLLKTADKFNKVLATISLSEQFLNGDIAGFDSEMIAKMSDTEKKDTMMKVVKQLVDVSLTASSRLDKNALEKNKVAQLFVNYYTDRRSRFNTITSQMNKVRKSTKQKNYKQAATQALFLATVTGMSVAMQNVIRGEEKEDDETPLETAFDFAMTPFTQAAQSIPGVDAAIYAYNSTMDYGNKSQVRPVSVPLLGVLTDGVAGVIALKGLLEDGLDFTDMKRKDRKALLTAAGYMVGGAPTNFLNKLIDFDGAEVGHSTEEMMEEIKDFLDVSALYKEKFKDVPEAQQFLEDITEVQKALPQYDNDITEHLPENAKETLKTALSGGDWTKFDEATGAVGVYQYTEERWNELMVTNPELGLTEQGRIARDPAQQEKAFEAEIQDNTKSLIAYDIPVTEENLLGAHKFGIDNYIAIMQAEGSASLGKVLGDEAKNPVFTTISGGKSTATSVNGVVADESLFDFIRGEETFQAESYGDQGKGAGVQTNGYGNTHGDLSKPIDKDEAEFLMRQHVANGEKELSKLITRKDLSQGQMNVLLDMHYNMGIGGMEKFIEVVNTGTDEEIKKSLSKYTKAKKRDKKGNLVKKNGKQVWIEMGGLVKRKNERLDIWFNEDSQGDTNTVNSVKNYLAKQIKKGKELTTDS